jgi:tRNA-specific 2-thiouridylase
MAVKKEQSISPKVFMAMSGGVDSSVSAALLQEAGFDVTGIYMKQWAPEILGKECVWKDDRQDAMRVAAQLNIPFQTWDFAKEYEKKVGKYMIDSYKKGLTPNPDVMCNKIIKFGLFFDRAMKEGADFVATGHYARIEKGKLAKAQDVNKDQTYFLYTLRKEQLDQILFPVGGYEKPEVRKLAKKFKLHNSEKKDSQGVCFVGQFDMKLFLKQYIKPKQGKIFDMKGDVIGSHDGAYYYTIGQRHGLDIKNGKGPYFVVQKDVKKNTIVVGSKKDLLERKISTNELHWIETQKKFPVAVEARVRYRTPVAKASLQKNGSLIFKTPQGAIAPGQSVVFYKKDVVLGGGIIS